MAVTVAAPPFQMPNGDDPAVREAIAARRVLDPEHAVDVLLEALRTCPDSAAYLFHLGKSYTDLRRHDDAIAAFDRSIAIEPHRARTHVNRGLAMMDAGRLAEAMADGLRATTLRPTSAVAWTGLGRIFSRIGLVDLAAKAFRRACTLDPARPHLKGLLLQEQMACCDWTDLDMLVDDIRAQVDQGHRSVNPFYWQAICESSESLQAVARQESAAGSPNPAASRRHASAAHRARMRIGYVSGELNTSANGICMAGVFAAHDRHAVDIVAFDNGVDDGSVLRKRIDASFGTIVAIRGMSDREFAATVVDHGIDVLVNLNGFFGNDRSAAFRLKPAPIQVNYLGCPGTMGTYYMDYIIADDIVIPPAQENFYDECIVRLPDGYYPTDRARPISDRVFSRTELGIPVDAFVFCCFNNSYKILPDMFAAWMRILKQVPGSVLWLIDANPAATANLRAQAAAHGVDPLRLIFGARTSSPDHLARHACADLFLDTLPYNAHTTAIDALWSGLPLLTCLGQTFPGRVAASVLTAIGLPDLVAGTLSAYERRAIELASDPGEVGRLRARLTAQRLTTPLFDTARYTRHLETAYRTMIGHHRDGLPPVNFSVG